MKTEIILILASVVLFVAYTIAVALKYGVLKSISESYYYVHPALFTLWIWSITVPLGIAGGTGFMFMASAVLCFVGAAPAFKSCELEERVHIIGATGGIVLGFASLLIDFDMYWPMIIMATAVVISGLFKIKNRTWWIECIAYVLIILGLMIEKL